MGPPAWWDYEFLALRLVVTLDHYCCPWPADPGTAYLCANGDAERAALQEIRGGRKDCS